MTKTLFTAIDQAVDRIIEQANGQEILTSTLPARKMLAVFRELRNPFKQRILAKFASGLTDPIAANIRALFNQKRRLPYFQTMISLSYFYWSWLGQLDLPLTTTQRDELTLSLIYGATGYKLLDTFCDESTDRDSQTEPKDAHSIYMAKYLIAYQESILTTYFPNHALYTRLQEKYNRLFCSFGMQELTCKYNKCPISPRQAIKLGHKSAPLLLYYSLALDLAGQKELIPDYEKMFLLSTASIQIHDDIFDAPEDLLHGNITLISQPFIESVDYASLLTKPNQLTKKFQSFLTKTQHDKQLFQLAHRLLEQALQIAQRHQDEIFELFILSKDLGILEKINKKEVQHETQKRTQSQQNHQRTHRGHQAMQRRKKA